MNGLIQSGPHVYQLFDGCKTWVPDQDTLHVVQYFLGLAGKSKDAQDISDPATMRAFGYIAGPRPPGVDVYGVVQ